MLSVITSMTSPTWFMLSISVLFDASTSLTALSTVLIFSPKVVASFVIFVTLVFTFETFSIFVWISFIVCAIDSIILADVSSSLESASIILLEEACVPLLRFLISSATTAKPLPASPALAASMDALSARRFVCEVIPAIVLVSSLTLPNSFLKSTSIFSTSFESSDILFVVSTTSTRSFALVSACSTEAFIRSTTCSIRPATSVTWLSITLVISIDETVLSFSTLLLSESFTMSSTTSSAPALFSSASSLTTVTPSTTSLLATLTCSTVLTTLARFSSIEDVSAPSDSTRCLIAIFVQA